MSLELEINGSVVEFSEATRIGLTFQRNTLAELEKRQGNTSNQFKLPKTKRNQIIFENADNVNSSTTLPYRKLSAKMRQAGVEIMPEAVASLETADKFYNLIVNNGVTSFFNLVGDKLLSDLPLSSSDHVWNATNAKDFTRSDWRYCLIDWGYNIQTLNTSNIAEVREIIPVMFVKYLLEKICSEIGYTATGSFIDSQQYPRLMYTPDTFTRTAEWKELRENIAEIATDWIFNTSDAPLDGSSITTTRNILNTNNDTDISGGPTGVIYTAPETIHGYLEASFVVEQMTVSPDPIYCAFDIVRVSDGAVMASTGDIAASIIYGDTLAVSLSVLGTLAAGSQYQWRMTMEYNRISPGITPQIKVHKSGTCRFIPYPEIIFGTRIDMASIYQTKQVEFIRELLKMKCINVDVNEVTKVIRFDFFNDLTDNIPLAKDWSDKVDLSVQPQLSYTYGNYGQRNNFKWKEHDTVTKGYGDYYLEVNNDKLELVKDQFVMNASATENVIRLAGRQCPKIHGIEASTRVWKRPNNRFLLIDTQTIPAGIRYNDGGVFTGTLTANIPLAYFKKDGKTDNLGFDDSLVETYYSTVKGVLDNVKFYKLAFKPGGLTSADIAALNFNIPIFLNVQYKEHKVNGLFYLNKLENFDGVRSTVGELLRL